MEALLGTRDKGQGRSDVTPHLSGSVANTSPGLWILRLSRPPGNFFRAQTKELGHLEQERCSPGTLEGGRQLGNQTLSAVLEESEDRAGWLGF